MTGPFWRAARLALPAMLCCGVYGATLNFSGGFASDADVALINLTLASNSVITVQSFGYGGSNVLSVLAGGFAGSLSLYDSGGNQVASDFVGGTVVGAGCSHAGNRDPVTGFCEDPSLSFSGVAGSYLLALSVQGNNGPGLFSDGFPLAPGTNFPGGPFVDPGDPTGATIRNGNWYLQVNLDGTADMGVPEPTSIALCAMGISTLIFMSRRKHV
jgi:hypothetical protein